MPCLLTAPNYRGASELGARLDIVWRRSDGILSPKRTGIKKKDTGIREREIERNREKVDTSTRCIPVLFPEF